MKKFLRFSSLALIGIAMMTIFAPEARSQSYSPFIGDNYAGILGVYDNPASLADSRYRVDVTLAGASLHAYNDYFGLQRRFMFQQINFFDRARRNEYRNILLNEPWDYPVDVETNNRFVSRNGNIEKDRIYDLNSTFDLQLLNFMVSFNNNRMSIGFTERLRGMSNINDVSQEFADLWFEEMPEHNYSAANPIIDETSRYSTATWNEMGISFASQIKDWGNHYLKGGLTLKLIHGLSSAYVISENMDLKIVDGTPDAILNADGEGKLMYGISKDFNKNYLEMLSNRKKSGELYDYRNVGMVDALNVFTNNFLQSPFSSENWKNLAFGLDLGLVYEWRPNYENYSYAMNGVEGLTRRDMNKYALRVSASVTDLIFGGITYERDPELTTMMLSGTNIIFDTKNLRHVTSNTTAETNAEIQNQFGNNPNATLVAAGKEYKVKVSPTLNLNVDYHFGMSNFYINAGASLPFGAFNKYDVSELTNTNYDEIKVHGSTILNVTPRYERKWFGASLPITYLPDYGKGAGGGDKNTYAPFNVGLGLRLGPVWVGSTTLFSSLMQKYWNGVDVCAAVKVPFAYKAPSDIDGDGVSDDKDECMYIPGSWETQGCPDTDGDGIIDPEDDCPMQPGIPEFNGCPDTDGDGIPDSKDKCPYEAGLPEFQGCPDRDGDGIPDYEDKCPDVPGIKELQGCPDIADRDHDGIPDDEDACPDVPGLKKYAGCPDTDGDGIPDNYDDCPTIAGTKENHGCPGSMLKVLNDVPGVFFDINKSYIKKQYHQELNEFADAILKCKNPKVHIVGHCDITGNDAINDPLSIRRAKAVKKYLVDRGIDADIITTDGKGSHQPIATNKTKEGRAQNRRVEIEATFE